MKNINIYYVIQKHNYQPETNNDVNSEKLSSLIYWRDGPILKGLKNGEPIILDDINFSKAQIIENLNSLLKTNIKYNVKYNKNYKYSIIQKSEDKEISQIRNFK